ncbi:hypothetical protein DFH09DRAFT_1406213 [Mycena vulgaris]|nr:hypothetical protein DFH09DRAFT_1406213 [Mycena vulgaris]
MDATTCVSVKVTILTLVTLPATWLLSPSPTAAFFLKPPGTRTPASAWKTHHPLSTPSPLIPWTSRCHLLCLTLRLGILHKIQGLYFVEDTETKREESRNNYSLLLARIHESAGPSSSSVSIPGSDLSYDASFLALRSPQNYTKIRFWEQAQYTKASKKSDSSSIVDDDEDDEDDDEGGKKFKGYPWVEDDNGTPMTKANSRALSSHLRSGSLSASATRSCL